MAYKYKLREAEAEATPSNREQVDYDIILTPKSVSVEDTIKALENIDNYGIYISNLSNNDPKMRKAKEAYFGTPAERRVKANQGKFPEFTNSSNLAFIKAFNSKSTLLKYKVKDDTIVFPKSGNPSKNLTKKMIDVVMKNAKIDYSVADKEAVDEVSTDKLDQEAKLYFMQQFKAGKIKELPKDPKAEYMKVKMTKKSSMSEGYDEFDMEDEGPDYNNISDLEDELRRLIRFSNQYGSKGADAKIEQLKQRIDQLKNQVNEAKNYFKGSHFGDELGNEFSVEKIYNFVKKNKEKYFYPEFPISKIKHNLEWWEKNYDIKNKEHKERMMNSDTSYPLLVVIEKGNNLSVADGLNRLYKAIKIEKKKTLPIYLVTKEEIEHLKKKTTKLKNQVNKDMKTKMTKKDLKEVIKEQIKSLIK